MFLVLYSPHFAEFATFHTIVEPSLYLHKRRLFLHRIPPVPVASHDLVIILRV